MHIYSSKQVWYAVEHTGIFITFSEICAFFLLELLHMGVKLAVNMSGAYGSYYFRNI